MWEGRRTRRIVGMSILTALLTGGGLVLGVAGMLALLAGPFVEIK